MAVRALGAGDAGWAAELMAARREAYAAYSPVLWRPARGIAELHAQFLGRQIQDPNSVALRTQNGFVISECGGGEGFIDDFAIDDCGSWAVDGFELLRAAWVLLSARGTSALRVVTAQADRPKVAMLVALGLQLVQQWWVKSVQPAPGFVHAPGRIDRPGVGGFLGPAPPVYDPGGPVLLADNVAVDLDVLEDEAARMGAVLVILPTASGNDLECLLQSRGWTVASQWYLGRPVVS